MLSFKGLEQTNKASQAISKAMHLGIIGMTMKFEIL